MLKSPGKLLESPIPMVHLTSTKENVWRSKLGALNRRFGKNFCWEFYCIIYCLHRLASERRGEKERVV